MKEKVKGKGKGKAKAKVKVNNATSAVIKLLVLGVLILGVIIYSSVNVGLIYINVLSAVQQLLLGVIFLLLGLRERNTKRMVLGYIYFGIAALMLLMFFYRAYVVLFQMI